MAAAAAAAGATGNAEERADRAVKPKGALKKGTAGSGGGEQKKKAAGGDDQLFQRQARAAAQTAARKAHSQLKVVERCVHRGVHGFRAYTRDTGQRTPPRPAFSGGEHRAGGRVHTPSRVAPPVATPLTYLPWLDSLAQHERRRVGVSAVGSLSLSLTLQGLHSTVVCEKFAADVSTLPRLSCAFRASRASGSFSLAPTVSRVFPVRAARLLAGWWRRAACPRRSCIAWRWAASARTSSRCVCVCVWHTARSLYLLAVSVSHPRVHESRTRGRRSIVQQR